MNNHSVIFTDDSVRSIFTGTKTQTRRLVSPQPNAEHDGEPYWNIGGWRAWEYRNAPLLKKGGKTLPCPYGQSQETVWVRETFCFYRKHGQKKEEEEIWYRADFHQRYDAWERDVEPGQILRCERWQSPIVMPKVASRLSIKIESIRVEKLQDITEEDAKAEGVIPYSRNGASNDPGYHQTYRSAYLKLWNELHPKHHWLLNPWVWVLTFSKAEEPK